MTLRISTGGTDIHVIERPNGGWVIQQGRSHVLVTPDEARQLSSILNNLATAPHGGQAVGPVKAKPPIIRYCNAPLNGPQTDLFDGLG
jgi:hypothetical protein